MTGYRVLVIDDELADLLRAALPRICSALDHLEQPAAHQTAGLTVPETAHELRISVRTVESMLADGTLASVRFGRRVVIPRSEIDRVLTASVASPVRRAG